MIKILRKASMVFTILVMAVLMVIPASAMDFTVRALKPENQRKNDSAFFDLLVKPGQEQDLVIEIGNSSSAEILVLVETITATTSRNGQINYTSRSETDESMKYSFEDIVNLDENYYTIPADSSIQVAIALSVPDDPFDGCILGSIRVLREATREEREAAGAIVNQYAHVTAVRLVQDDDAENLPADFALGEINVELVNYRASIIANIRNLQPRIIKGATAKATIYVQGTDEIIFENNLDSLDFAPNSIFPYSFVDSEGYGIDAGDYTVVIDIEFEGESWKFEEDFNIPQQVADEVNEGAVNQQGQRRPGTEVTQSSSEGVPMWAVIAIGVGAATLTAVIILIILMVKRKPALSTNAT